VSEKQKFYFLLCAYARVRRSLLIFVNLVTFVVILLTDT